MEAAKLCQTSLNDHTVTVTTITPKTYSLVATSTCCTLLQHDSSIGAGISLIELGHMDAHPFVIIGCSHLANGCTINVVASV